MLRSDDELLLACGADDAYAVHLLVMLQSLVRSQPETTRIACVIMDGGVSAEHRAKVDALLAKESPGRFRHEWLAVDSSRFAGLMATPLLTHLTGATLMRLLLPELLPDAERVFYIDSDVLVQGDLRPFYDTTFDGKHLVGVQDFFLPTTAHLAAVEPDVPGYRAAFNAGVIVMNLAKFRESGAMTTAMNLMARQPSWSDQEGLNAAVAGDWVPAPVVYNLQTHWMYADTIPESAARHELKTMSGDIPAQSVVAHFTGQVKPWNCGIRHPFRVRYEYALRDSGWFTPGEWVQWRARRVRDYVAERLGRTTR